MKRYAILLIAFTLFAWGFVTHADSGVEGEKHGKSLEVVLQEIRESQGIGEKDRIDCNRVTDQQFEELGEALMSMIHPDPEEHEMLDRMMGGEGSPMLSTMHRMMAARYLGCYYGGMMEGMMGRSMMKGPPYSRWGGHGGMMGFGYGGLLMWATLLILIGVVVYFVIQSAKTKDRGVAPKESPLEILKKRYAKGEMTKDEFEAMKRDLQG